MSGLAAASSNAHQAVGFPSLFVLVALGAIVPVIPTGALVSAAAVVAWHAGTPYDLPAVFVVSSLAALVGDTALYWLASRGSGRWLERLRARADLPRLETAQRRLDANGTIVLVVSRLIPAGRIPVMLACLFAGWSVRRFVRADVAAALAWSGGYLAVGVLGGALFAEPWQGIVAVIGLALLSASAPNAWRWLRTRRGRTPGPSDAAPTGHAAPHPPHLSAHSPHPSDLSANSAHPPHSSDLSAHAPHSSDPSTRAAAHPPSATSPRSPHPSEESSVG